MASFNPTGSLAWLRSESAMEQYLSNPQGKSLFAAPPFEPYRRYAFRDIEIQPRVGTRFGPEHASGQESLSFLLPRHGDLLGRLTLRFDLNFGSVDVDAMLKNRIQPLHPLAALLRVAQGDLYIGNKPIQTIYGEAAASHDFYRRGFPIEVYPNAGGRCSVFIDLPFFLGKTSADALPLALITEHDAELRLRLTPAFERNPLLTAAQELLDWPTPTLEGLSLTGRYFFLPSMDRAALLATKPYQRIIEDWAVHKVPIEGPASVQRIEIPFRGPISSLFFTFLKSLPNNFIIGPHPPEYFRDYTQDTHHLNSWTLGPKTNAYLVHFDENGDALTPDGQIDFGSFDRVELVIDFADAVADETYLHVYGRGWNVFLVRDGMGGKVYAF